MSPDQLPRHLAERIRTTAEPGQPVAGEFVLYWMHHAVRTDENPALDVARMLSVECGKPLLVYQGLGGAHPFNNDRHHSFIMEGARDVAARCEAMGVRHVFHLGARGPSPLRSLTQRAAIVVSEDFPVAPFPGWSRTLRARSGTPLWLVDTACVVPMRLPGAAFARAFEFRRATATLFAARVSRQWPACAARNSAFEGDVGFVPTVLASADIAQLCAECAIDHAVAPVERTPGGSRAGYARWNAFVAHGLSRYAATRNDPQVAPPQGASRMSPYLHHGHVSPMRLAREASEEGSKGAEKYLDELLIWRELSHNFAFHNDDPEAFASLPEWSQQTLTAHAGDRRAALLSQETLDRGRTGDRLWDAAQASLLVHGELHNNLRMTWGKAPLGWTRDAQAALASIVEMNHRYALDGSDPNSFGGLLYSLGLFDRPFKPEQPVFGAVRERSTAAHARRLDVDAFAARMNQRAGRRRRVAVIGAGIAGLAAARTLHDNGFDVQVFERGRRVGGRASTRTGPDGQFDHGAQYFTARDARFARRVDSWVRDGHAAPWRGVVGKLLATGEFVAGERRDDERYVGLPAMSSLATHLADALQIHTGAEVAGIARNEDGWSLDLADGAGCAQGGGFDALVLAVAPEQAARLPGVTAALLGRIRGVSSTPCWCAMVTLGEPLASVYDAVAVESKILAWAARDASKPGRAPGERWVLHATPSWSAERLEASRDDVAAQLYAAFRDATGLPMSAPVHLRGHRWGLARTPAPLDTPSGEECLFDAATRLAVCGDWCRSSRVEDAFLSGTAAAGRVAGALSR